jgi:ATP-dependent Clp protease ATP-binding subunit ClpC
MQLANREAQRFNHEYIGTEHILLALLAEGRSVAAEVLRKVGADLPTIRREVEKTVQAGPGGFRVALRWLPTTPRAKKAFEYAVLEARALGHNYIGTEHLLLGLLREQDGAAATVLTDLGVKLEEVRERLNNPRVPSSPARVGWRLGRIVRRLFGGSDKETSASKPEATEKDAGGRDWQSTSGGP